MANPPTKDGYVGVTNISKWLLEITKFILSNSITEFEVTEEARTFFCKYVEENEKIINDFNGNELIRGNGSWGIIVLLIITIKDIKSVWISNIIRVASSLNLLFESVKENPKFSNRIDLR